MPASEGFTFNPGILTLNGQPIGGGLNFTAINAVSQVDQTSQAYDFINNLNNAAYSWLTHGPMQMAMANANSLFNTLATDAGYLGLQEIGVQKKAVSNACSGFFGCLF